MANKKAFDLARDSVYVAEPITELRIIGGLVLCDEEQGDLDTEPDESLTLKDLRRLKKWLDESFLANIAHRGVDTPIRIVKIDDVATVVAGKSRVRAARRANRIRKAEGLPLIKIKCVIQRDASPLALMASMISENNARTDDDLADKIDKLKALLNLGASEADAALVFGVKQTTIRGWLAFEDAATEMTKQAVKEGRLPASTAAELAKIKDPEEQNAALVGMLAAPEKRAKTARAAQAIRKGKTGSKSASDRKSQQLLLETIKKADHPRASPKTLAFFEGAEEMLKLVLGQKGVDDRLVGLLTKARNVSP
jgi:hypothetical protein